jgi:hypothetical protein
MSESADFSVLICFLSMKDRTRCDFVTRQRRKPKQQAQTEEPRCGTVHCPTARLFAFH